MQGEPKVLQSLQEGREAPAVSFAHSDFRRAQQTQGPGKKAPSTKQQSHLVERQRLEFGLPKQREPMGHNPREWKTSEASLKCCSTVSLRCLLILTHTHKVRPPQKPSKQQQLELLVAPGAETVIGGQSHQGEVAPGNSWLFSGEPREAVCQEEGQKLKPAQSLKSTFSRMKGIRLYANYLGKKT